MQQGPSTEDGISAERLAFRHYLRTGAKLPPALFTPGFEAKFNPYHDPRNGRFTFAPGGPRLDYSRPDRQPSSRQKNPKAANARKSSAASRAAWDTSAKTIRPRTFSNRAEFFAYAAPYAIRSEKETGVPSSITLAQAVIESANGNRHIGSANNYFGIKASRTKSGAIYFGEVAKGFVVVSTREVRNGKSFFEEALFRSYASMEDSFIDHGIFLRDNHRYSEILRSYATDGDTVAFARGLQKAGYATDPNYADMIISIIKRHGLNRYNIVQAKAR